MKRILFYSNLTGTSSGGPDDTKFIPFEGYTTKNHCAVSGAGGLSCPFNAGFVCRGEASGHPEGEVFALF